MTQDPDAIYQALRVLWKRDGATVVGIRAQPALMGLEYVYAKAFERHRNASPHPNAVAEVCRLCILEAANAQYSPPPELAQADRDKALAARIILGVEPDTEHRNLKGRRLMLEQRLFMTYHQYARARDKPHTFEVEQIVEVANYMAKQEEAHLDAQQQDTQAAETDSWGNLGDFECLSYYASLELRDDDRLKIRQHFDLIAHRDNAYDFRAPIDPFTLNGATESMYVECNRREVSVSYSIEGANMTSLNYLTAMFDPPRSTGESIKLLVEATYLPLSGGFYPYLYVRTTDDLVSLKEATLSLKLPEAIGPANAAIVGAQDFPQQLTTWPVERGKDNDDFEVYFTDVSAGMIYALWPKELDNLSL